MKPLNPITEPTTMPARAGAGITIIYEDRPTGLQAKRFSDLLTEELGEQPPGRLTCWRSELIELPEIAAEIACDAAASEFVILSLRGDTRLSLATKRWIESWLEAASGPSCLVALFDPQRSTGPQAGAIRCYLRHVAAQAGVAFFAHCAVVTNERDTPSFTADENPAAKSRQRPHGVIASFFPTSAAA